jgi:hypothetical protein
VNKPILCSSIIFGSIILLSLPLLKFRERQTTSLSRLHFLLPELPPSKISFIPPPPVRTASAINVEYYERRRSSQTLFTIDAHLTEGRDLGEEQTINKGKPVTEICVI